LSEEVKASNLYFGCLIELHSVRLNHPNGNATPCLDENADMVIGEVENKHRERAIQMVLSRIDLTLEV
jgi:hypothetical protein